MVQVVSKKHIKKDPTKIALLVDSISQEEVNVFDSNRIKEDLRHIDIDEHVIERITPEIEDRLMKAVAESKFKRITPDYIRAFINIFLMENGFSKELKSRSEFVRDHNDTIAIIENATNENGNTNHNPESINLAFAEDRIKDFALKKVFSSDIAKAHLEGKIHIHDLGMIRAYAFDGDLNFIDSEKYGEISIKSLYDIFKNNEEILDDRAKIIKNINVTVSDKNSKTIINNVIKIEEEKDIYEVELENGNKIYITEDHACMVIREGKEIETPLFDIKIGELFYVKN